MCGAGLFFFNCLVCGSLLEKKRNHSHTLSIILKLNQFIVLFIETNDIRHKITNCYILWYCNIIEVSSVLGVKGLNEPLQVSK